MNIIFIILFMSLIIAIAITLWLLKINIEKSDKFKTIQILNEMLDKMGFNPIEIIYCNKHLSLALNNKETKLAIIEDFNPNNRSYFKYKEVALSFIEKIEKSTCTKIHYLKKGEKKVLNIYPINNEINNFIHKIYSLSLIKKIQTKFPQQKFTLFDSSDWECSYFWAYSEKDNNFAYLKTGSNFQFGKINLRREHFTIDTKYKYFEAPIFGINQQLFNYNNDFLFELFNSMLSSIKEKYGEIKANSIYYDNYNNIIYLTNAINSMQSVNLEKVYEINYKDNRISFELEDKSTTINYIAKNQQILDFEDFIIDYNLKKIANSFCYNIDKLINTTTHTKFIIDFTRERIIYCANLNKINSFNYMVISFNNLKDICIKKTSTKYFARITTKDKETIDITCDKKEIAQYIEAQISKHVLR